MAKSIPESGYRVWPWAIGLAIVGGLYFVQDFLSVIALAILIAYIVNPFYKWSLNKFKNTGLALSLTTTLTILVILIPLLIVFALSVSQLSELINNLQIESLEVGDLDLFEVLTNITHGINRTLENIIGVSNIISDQDVQGFVTNTLPNILNTLLGLVLSVVGGFPSFFTKLIIYLFVFTGVLKHQKTLLRKIEEISPFTRDINKRYLNRMGAMAQAMIRGQIIIATVQGIIGALSLSVLGLGDYIIFFAVIFSIMNLIPLGSGIITMPLGVGAILLGQIWPGLIIILVHLVVVTNIDNILRPMLVPKEAYLPASLTMLAAFAGVGLFGLLGVVYGPIIMIVLTTTIDSYIEYNHKYLTSST